MRVLYQGIGDCQTGRHLPQSWPDRLFERRLGDHEVVTFGHAPDLDIVIPFGAPFAEVVRRLPDGWLPDVCICMHPDFLMIPHGIEEAPFPTVAVTADWDYRIGVARTMADTFDLVVALGDESCRAMEVLGARRTLPFHYFGFPEESIPAELTPISSDRAIDVLFTGTIADHTSPDRSRWLGRLAALSDRYQVYIDDARMSQTAYRDVLRQAKLVFTFHRRGELQLRFTDAVIEGACVLDNGVETARFFDPRTEYAAYDEATFEAVVEQHLADDWLRMRKVEAARRKVLGQFGSLRRLLDLFAAVERELPSLDPTRRVARSLPHGERCRRTAEHLYDNQYACSLGPRDEYLPAAVAFAAQATPGPRADNDRAVLLASQALQRVKPTMKCAEGERVLAAFEALTETHPRYAMGWFNRAYALRANDDHEAAAACFAQAYEILLDPTSDFDLWALYVREQDRQPQSFEKPILDARLALAGGASDESARRTLAGNCAFFIARQRRVEGRLHDALELLDAAATLDPVNTLFAKDAAHLADLLGECDLAERHYERALALRPLDVQCRLDAMSFCARTDRPHRALSILRETIGLSRAVKKHQRLHGDVQAMARTLQLGQGGLRALTGLPLDRFAADALAELCSSLGDPPDPRVLARVHELLHAQGKVEAAAEWAAHYGLEVTDHTR
jgi:tetratricopeptide (TPR) repeat protein